MFSRILLLFVILLHVSGSASEKDLLLLKDDHIVLGVKTELGGRVMLFRRKDGENVIHSNPEVWKRKDGDIPLPDCKSPFVEYQGHIVWVGPAERWWKDQKGDLSPPDSGFHPDPYLIYDRCKVVTHSNDRLVLQGHQSPLNGMSMKKEFRLLGDGKVKIEVSVTNLRDRPVRWNLWSNTRFHPEGKSGFPAEGKGNLQFSFSAWSPLKERPLQYENKGGYWSFTRPADTVITEQSFYGKLGFHKYVPIYAVYKNNLFCKEVFEIPAKGRCPQGTLATEIYQRYSADPRGHLMELEFQLPQFTLKPGESVSFAELWILKRITSDSKTKAIAEALCSN